MNNRLIKELRVPVSYCDNNGKMNVPGMFTLLMDMASEHAAEIGMGMDAMANKGLIWLAVKTKLRIHRRPQMFSPITATTWPGVPGRIRCDRLYTITQDDRLIIEAKNEWAMYEPATGKLRKMENGYPKELEIWPETACDGRYLKLKDDFEDSEELGKYTVKSTDLDTSQHMNNVKYINVIFSMFSSKQLEEMEIAEVEIAYKNQCYEGEDLTLKRKAVENGFEIGIIKADGTPGAIARITLRQHII